MDKSLPLDGFDLKILSILQRDGRIQKQALADAICLSASPCAERLKRLEKAGYIKCYRAEVNIARFVDLFHATIIIKLESVSRETAKPFEQHILGCEEITHCEVTVGDADYVLQFVGRDFDHYNSFMVSLLSAPIRIQKMFGHIRSSVVKNEPFFPVSRAIDWRAQQGYK